MFANICTGRNSTSDDFKRGIVEITAELEKNKKVIDFIGPMKDPSNRKELVGLVNWMWKNANRGKELSKDWDVNKYDMKRFKKYVSNHIDSNFGVTGSKFSNYFKLPKRIFDKWKEGAKFYKDLENAQSFSERRTGQGSLHVNKLLDDMFQMFGDRGFSKAEFSEFKKLEANLAKATNKTQRAIALAELMDYTGQSTGNGNETKSSKVLKDFNDLLIGNKTPETELERGIVNEYNILRVSTAKDLLNTAQTTKRIILKYASTADVTSFKPILDKITGAIDTLLVQTKIDSNSIFKDKDGTLMVYDHKSRKNMPYKVYDYETGEYVIAKGVKKFAPEYVIGLASSLRKIQEFTLSNSSNWVKAEQNPLTKTEFINQLEKSVQPYTITDRLTPKGDHQHWVTMDPSFYLPKYVNDVSNANFRAHVSEAYLDSIAGMHKMIRNGGVLNEYAQYKLNVLQELKESVLNQNRGEITELDRAIQVVNAWEYIAKLGWGIKSGIKNRLWEYQNWMWFGKRGLRRAKEFYATTSRLSAKGENINNAMMMTRQMRRFGLKIGENQAGASLSAATAGSLDTILTFKGMEIDAKGELIRSNDPTYTQALASGLGAFASAEKLADAMPNATPAMIKKTLGKIWGPAKMMAWAENKNRESTFKTSFANAFLGEATKEKMEWHRGQIAKSKSAEGKIVEPYEISDRQVYDKIEAASGNIAANMVKTIHYDYNRWSKAKVLQSRGGKVFGQFKHFKFAYFDMMYNLIKEGGTDIMIGDHIVIDPVSGNKILNPTIDRIIRASFVNTIIPLITAVGFGLDFGGIPGLLGNSSSGLIDDPVLQDVKVLADYFMNDPDASEEEMLKHYNATYGKGLLAHLLGGPGVGDLMSYAQLFDFLKLNPDEYRDLRNLNFDPGDPDWNYNVARTFSIAGARWGMQIAPAVFKGDWEQVQRLMTGTYYPKYIKKWFGMERPLIAKGADFYNSVAGLPDVQIGKKEKRKKNVSQRDIRNQAYATLTNLRLFKGA
jgi:hypothetical protein